MGERSEQKPPNVFFNFWHAGLRRALVSSRGSLHSIRGIEAEFRLYSKSSVYGRDFHQPVLASFDGPTQDLAPPDQGNALGRCGGDQRDDEDKGAEDFYHMYQSEAKVRLGPRCKAPKRSDCRHE